MTAIRVIDLSDGPYLLKTFYLCQTSTEGSDGLFVAKAIIEMLEKVTDKTSLPRSLRNSVVDGGMYIVQSQCNIFHGDKRR